ncbi:aminopeptidase P N-terminal domain-containing protein [Acinetobacter larvae]|uniref:Xaa-Pro aminopeptidase n=1 Tax=Acinetobacter larvae TaxID=1789224 RepID=A0A1B2M117_9GAMM|nr:aminopeptidase P N-terminal domain-containing protein [Acinetobacter larvae]AOA58896.1 Xaa-Pro aminopeptidase [Acinetobacter larvae]
MKFSQDIFEQRRDRLAQMMGANCIAVIETSPVAMRNRDADYKYRGDSSFYYLTGFTEPEAVAVIETFDTAEQYCYTLFCRERHHEMEIWNGRRAGTAGALADYAAHEAYAIEFLDENIIEMLQAKEQLYYRIGQRRDFDHKVTDWLRQTAEQYTPAAVPKQLRQLDEIVDEMRVIKSADEIACMETAAAISVRAHQRAMQQVRPGMMEYALEAELNYIFAQAGCVPAYTSIVGGGANACILHYVENDQVLNDGDLVLIDAGCEYAYYAADITRTFPVNGKFSPAQKALYQLVLDAQLAAIAAVQVGAHYHAPHQVVVEILVKGLVTLGLLHGDIDTLIEDEAYRRFYMHGTGHWLGIDVHDVGAYKQQGESRRLEAGMVLTIEPGLYIAEDDETVDAKWRGIGIRIEDDVLVTAQGPRVLTDQVAKSIDEIEQLMAQHKAATC